MRSFFISLLLLNLLGLSECAAPTPEAPPTAASAPAEEPPHSSSGIATGGVPGPDPAHRRVSPADVLSRDTVYAATLPVRNDPDGSIRIRVTVNPRAHTLENIRVLFGPHPPSVTYRQLGQGVGQYEASTGHYYFNAGDQRVRKLGGGLTDYGQLQNIGGWVHPESSTAAVAHEQAVP